MQAREGEPCTMKAQCAADECCQVINIVVASRKRQLVDLPPGGAGTCQRYKKEGDLCDSIAVMNGFCGCADALSCRVVRLPGSNQNVGRRGALPPGYAEKCVANYGMIF
ncbi:hypothetical protein V1264_010875 [Littorina saxatilis]|uniref:Uncharacterized protein n=1 Tax=Littorina saxatilis TaxID=31220 RepID=A0AAN9BTQ5_9CAEN